MMMLKIISLALIFAVEARAPRRIKLREEMTKEKDFNVIWEKFGYGSMVSKLIPLTNFL